MSDHSKLAKQKWITMPNTDTYSSPIIETIIEWLGDMSPKHTTNSLGETLTAVSEAVLLLGYGAPFDKEQRTINALLADRLAGKIACIVVWGFYHDSKMVEAKLGGL